MLDDGTLAAQQPSGREIVTRALALLRASYVFPELAQRAAVAVEARLAAGDYDELDELGLTELLTDQHRLPRRTPDSRPGQRRPGHHRGDGAGGRNARAHHRPAAQRRRLDIFYADTGETGGGAHPTRPFGISAAVHIAIPFARSVNPVTGTNWQGTGVVPDIAVSRRR